MKRWNKENIRTEILRTGMGCFAFGAGMTLFNLLFLPIGRRWYGYHHTYCLIAFFAALAGYLLLGKVMRKMSDERLRRIRCVAVPGFLIALFILQIVMGYFMEYTPSGDNFAIYKGSQMLAENGRFDETTEFELYFARFPNQWGFLLLCTAIRKAAGLLGVENIFMFMVVVQALLYIPGVLSALAIARKSAGGTRAELMLLVMLMTCLPLYLAASVLYTDTFCMPFVPIALNFALDVVREKDRKKQVMLVIACGVSATIGSMVKMIVLIVLIAAVICWLLLIKSKRALLYGALCALIFALGNGTMQQTLFKTAMSRQLYEQHNTPKIHWVLMSIPSSDNEYGIYSYDYSITWGMMEEGASRKEVMDSIYSRMKDKIYTLRYPNRLILAALRKNVAAFGDGTFGMTEMLDDGPVRENRVSSAVLGGRPNFAVYQGITSGIYYAQLLLALLGCIRDIRRYNLRVAIGYIAVFGMMLFLMFWEARTRYFFGFVPVILLLGSIYAADRSEESIL